MDGHDEAKEGKKRTERLVVEKMCVRERKKNPLDLLFPSKYYHTRYYLLPVKLKT
jgi:hypothetical protein